MKFTIGNEVIDAQPFDLETFTSEKSGNRLRKIKIKFGIQGNDAIDRYHNLERVAAKYGVMSDDPDGVSRILWKSNVYLDSWQSAPSDVGGNWYEAIWSLEEAED